jgi:ABC-type Fe3+-hydroxamate transport system substrate-binding protein
MLSFVDQVGHRIQLHSRPRRIISLVPSQTELLFDLGLNEEIVGITKFCVHPQQWFQMKPRVGGTKQVNIDAIDGLQPDLIIANKEENSREQVEMLATRYAVWTSDIKNLQDALWMIEAIGDITAKSRPAQVLADKIRRKFEQLPPVNRPKRAAYLVWKNPYMTVGHDTFIHTMMTVAGFENVFSDRERYPVVTPDEIAARQPEYLLLSSEPFPFSQKHIAPTAAEFPSSKIRLVDGEMFSWYGSRLVEAAAYFERQLTVTFQE